MTASPQPSHSWHIPQLTAVDKTGRVVKDDSGLLVVDQRDKRIAGYRMRWYVDGFAHAHSRSFKRNQLDEAIRLRVRLLDAAERALPADGRGLPIAELTPETSTTPRATSGTLIDELKWARDAHCAGLRANTRTGYRSTVEFIEYAAQSGEVSGFHPALMPEELTPEICQNLLLFRRQTNFQTPGRRVSFDTERLFSTYTNKLFCILANRGRFASNPWGAAKDLLRRSPHLVLSEKNVASQERVLDLADAIAAIPGGERFACVVRTVAKEGPRPGEIRAVSDANFRGRHTTTPFLRLEESRPTVSAKDDESGSRNPTEPLKHRAPGEHRDVPLFDGVLADVDDHLNRFCGDGQPFFSMPNGSVPDASSWLRKYWHPAVDAVFGDSPEAPLRQMSFRHLRHSAITWWLSSGVPVQQAAAWAGNSPDVLLKHYAGIIDSLSIPANPSVRHALFGSLELSGSDSEAT